MITKYSKLELMPENDILFEFRNSLVALYPILIKLECIENDTQPYDNFDEIAESLWKVLVCKSFAWKYSLDIIPEIGKYGYDEIGANGSLEIMDARTNENMRFIEFVGCRDFGIEPFNAVSCVNKNGNRVKIEFSSDLQFKWNRVS
jgi:hypothetical protein